MNDNTDLNKKNVTLPILITRGLAVFPSVAETIAVARPASLSALALSLETTNSLIVVGMQKKADVEEIKGFEDIYEYATLCRITNVVDAEDERQKRIRVQGMRRMKIESMRLENDHFIVDASAIQQEEEDDPIEQKGLIKRLVQALDANRSLAHDLPRQPIAQLSSGSGQASDHVDVICSYLQVSNDERISLLGEPSVNKRLAFIISFINRTAQNRELDDKIDNTVRERAEKSQKEYFLREKMRVIKDELGEGKDDAESEDAIRKRLEENPYPENVKKKVLSELHRYQMMPEASLESSLIMNYIQTLLNTPWYQKTDDNDDIDNVRKILDEDHYGLEKVKKRIIEYLAVKQKTGNLKAPILCFYGPPGCGKTSLAKSIARALDRKFYKASLGGVSDESEIRGHRRTYVGSMPGRIIQGMNRSGVINPVFLLDEIDKVGGNSYHGDPSSALLEVLDPEQNTQFNDNYLEEPYDLSNVLFIATANYLENVPAPLLDRLELIEVPSYTELEKIKIARGFLVRKQMGLNGLKEGEIEFTEEGIKEMIECYTREAGVRQIERLIATCCRKAVVELVSDPNLQKPIVIDAKKAIEYLGVEIFEDTKKEKEPQIGVVTGLAYTEFGGDILPIEVNYFAGKGGLVLTGKLGDVMKESCTIALDYIRANSKKYGIDDTIFEHNDIHIHVPEGAVPKDGPSAGVAITTAIISCLTHQPIDNNVAMTGEVTLRGKALPIGGLREKSLAALRSGIKTIIVPEDNRKDVSELPEEVKKDLKIVYMKTVDDALKVALYSSPEKAA